MSEKPAISVFILTVDYLLCSEDGGSWFVRNVS